MKHTKECIPSEREASICLPLSEDALEEFADSLETWDRRVMSPQTMARRLIEMLAKTPDEDA